MKPFIVVFFAVILLFAWNRLTCQYCPKAGDLGQFRGSMMTMRECAIHGEYRPITRAFVGVGWQVNIWIPFIGCVSNDPTPLYVNVGPVKVTINTWFKGWHRVKVVHLRLK